jgi:hypothetical protein
MNKMMMMRFDWFFALALLVSLYFPLEAATLELQQQEIRTEICYCAPNSYEFTLDFLLTCPPVNITLGDAVAATTCMVSPFGDPEVSDLVPVSVQSIDILELNQNLQVIVQENIGGDFIDGDTFSYISYAAIPGMIVNPEDLPRAIQLNIVGVNKDGEEIINVYLITFTNACGAYPVLSEGQFAGWTRFVSFFTLLKNVDYHIKCEFHDDHTCVINYDYIQNNDLTLYSSSILLILCSRTWDHLIKSTVPLHHLPLLAQHFLHHRLR